MNLDIPVNTPHLAAARQAETDARLVDIERRIESILLGHGRILEEHSRLLEDHGKILAALPDAVRDRMGFRP